MKDYQVVFEEHLKAQGLVLTPQRLSILDTVFSIHSHFDAESLLAKVQEINQNVSRATIYRTLPLLIDAGLIITSEKIGENETYEHTLGHSKHFHFLCSVCNNIIEEDESPELLALMKKVCKKNNFKMQDYILTIKGVCNDCKK